MKITFLGAGSTVFVKNILGDLMLTDSVNGIDVALYDIDKERLEDSYGILTAITKTIGRTDVKYYKYLGTENLKEALRGADFAVNAVQVGGYDPCTISDFEIPKKYGLKQTIADTLGIGGIFRALRTIPVMKMFADVMEEVCPRVILLNYTNPMAMLTGYMQRYTRVNTVGLCHSVQACVPVLLKELQMSEYTDKCRYQIAGINHQSWLLKIETLDGKDLYPEIKKRAQQPDVYDIKNDLVRLDIMKNFGHYNTESSEHTAEYLPYYIKNAYPELIERFNIPIDEYLRRCVKQIENWKKQKEELTSTHTIEHKRSEEYASKIIDGIVNDKPMRIHGNVINKGLITNLPQNACVEVPCLIDRNGVNPCYVGELPEQLAALNRTNINPQLMTIKAANERKKEYVYMAAYLDPHTSAELSMDDIKSMCDDLFEAHKDWMPKYN